MAGRVSRTTISVATDVFNAGLARAKKLKYKTFSAYIAHLIHKDVTERPDHIHVRSEDSGGRVLKPFIKYELPARVAEEPETMVAKRQEPPNEEKE